MQKYELSLYLDYYDKLLTEHTKNVLQLAVEEDLSLAEISEELGISRQAVHDRLVKGRKQLISYEDKLNLIVKRKQRQVLLDELERLLQLKELNLSLCQTIIQELKEV